MVKAIVNGTVIADSIDTIVVEGNHYFPPSDVKTVLFSDSNTSSVCAWKGPAQYYDASIEGKNIKDIAWYYPTPSAKATQIKSYIAFYKVRRSDLRGVVYLTPHYKNKVDIQE
ncbi:hypothetical protein HETIRDRAFT_104872 [Heterobasidion irregulare TC 32-1]|uniref:DUF427 domain-containing protein n=1 Tax=Heterobasidion irregulare (strain TC 32-1) TaxID=747525 RepID=W4K6T2_HETIT|nr:uncharacterized protein HETIRDRAFT_104872 [Heterobasidion irregulare TC 32-1]ETW81542.1 hypothetical protein HETIRDRAFT_104872 [Heterobasidion irregulare TC 32-1]